MLVSLDASERAAGDFYWDDGDTIIEYDKPDATGYLYATYSYENKVLTMSVHKSYGGAASARLDDVWIYSVSVASPSVLVNNVNLDASKVDYDAKVCAFSCLHSSLPLIPSSLLLFSF